MANKQHLRLYIDDLKLRSDANNGNILEGCACPYNQFSNLIYGYFYERFNPQAFRNCLAENPDIFATIDHDFKKIIGRSSANTLKLTNKDDGLYAEVNLPNTTFARDLAESVSRGDIRGMSFIFETVSDIRFTHDGKPAVEITEAKLHEVTFTAIPCYSQTSAALRSNVCTLDDYKRMLPIEPIQQPKDTPTIVPTPNLTKAMLRASAILSEVYNNPKL